MSRIYPVRDSLTVDLTTTDFSYPVGFNNVYVGGSGTLIVNKPNGGTQTYTGMAAGVYHAIQGVGIVRSGTTATGLVVGLS